MDHNKSSKSTPETYSPICFITGASSGIGRAIAMTLLYNGYRVIGASRKLPKLNLDPEQNIWSDNYYALKLDVTGAVCAQSILAELPDGWDTIDILVNCAGSDSGGRQPFHQGNLEDWIETIDTNVKGLLRVTSELLPSMLTRNYGDIINIGSYAGIVPAEGITAYSTSKHAMNGFSESLRLELGSTNIRVMQVLPGRVRTGFAGSRLRSKEKGQQYYDSIDRWLLPEDIANAVLHMLKLPRHVEISRFVIAPKPPKPE